MKGHVKKNLRKMLAMLLAVAMTVTYLPETSLMAFAAEGQESVQEADASQPAEAAVAETADNAAEDEAAADNATVADTAETPAENADATADSIAAENTDAATAAADPAAESSVGGQSAEPAADNASAVDTAAATPAEPAADNAPVAVSTDVLNTYAAPDNIDAPLLFGFNGDRYDENGYVGDIGLNMDDRSNYWAEWGGSLESGLKTIYIAPDSYWLEYNETDDVNENDIPIYIRMPAGSQKPTVSLDSTPGTDDWLQRVSLDNEWTSIDFSTNYGNDNTPDIVNYTCFRVILHVHERLCGGAAQFKINGETYTIDEAVVGYSFDNGTSWKFLTDPNAVVALDKDNTIQLGIFTEPDGDTLYRAVTDQPNHIGSLNDVADMLSVNNIASSNTAATNAWNDYCAQKDANENPISYDQGCTNDGRNYYYPIFTYGGDRSSNKPTTDVYYPSLTVAKDGACEVHLGIYSGPNLNIRISTLTGYALKQDDESKLVSQWDAGPNNKIVKPESGRDPKFYLYDKNSNPVTDDPNDSTYYLQDNPRFWLDGPVGYAGNVYLGVEESGSHAKRVYVALDFSNIPDTVWDEDFEVQFDCVVRKSDNDNFYREFNYRDEKYRLSFASEEPDVIIFGVGDGHDFWDAGNPKEEGWDDWRADSNHFNWDDWWIAEPSEGNPHITNDFLVEAWQYRVTNNHINKSGSDGKLYLNSGNIWGNTLIFYARIEADRDHATTRFEIGTDAAGGTNAWIKSIKSENSLGSAGHQSMTVGGKTYNYYKVELEVEKGRFAEWEEYIQVNTDNSNTEQKSYKYHFCEMTPQYQISDNGTDWPMDNGEPIWEELTNFDEPIALKKGQYIRFNVDGTAPDGNPRGKVEIYGMREQWKENSSGKVYYEFENETFFDRPVINKNAHDYLKEELGRDIYGENGNYQIFDYGNNSTPWYPVFKALDYGDNGGRIGAWDYGREMVGVDFRVRCMPDFSLRLANGDQVNLVTEDLDWGDDGENWETIWNTKSNEIPAVTGKKLRLYLYENGRPCTGDYEFEDTWTNNFRFESDAQNYAVCNGRWYNEYGDTPDENGNCYDEVSDSGLVFTRDNNATGNPWYIELTFKDGIVPEEEYRIELNTRICGMKKSRMDWIWGDVHCLLRHKKEATPDVLVFGLGDNDDFSGMLEEIKREMEEGIAQPFWKDWTDKYDAGFDFNNPKFNPYDRWNSKVPDFWNNESNNTRWGLKTPEYYLSALNFAVSNGRKSIAGYDNVIIADTNWSYSCYNWDEGKGKPVYCVYYRVLESKDTQGENAFSIVTGEDHWVKDWNVEYLGAEKDGGKTYNYYKVEMFIDDVKYMSEFAKTDSEFTLTTAEGTAKYYMREAYVEYQTKATQTDGWTNWEKVVNNRGNALHVEKGSYIRFRVGGNAVTEGSFLNARINGISRTWTHENGNTAKGLFSDISKPNENDPADKAVLKKLKKDYDANYDDWNVFVFKQGNSSYYPEFQVESVPGDCRLNFDIYDANGRRNNCGLCVDINNSPDFNLKLGTADDGLMPIVINGEYGLTNYRQNNEIKVPDDGVYKFYIFDGGKPVVSDKTSQPGIEGTDFVLHELEFGGRLEYGAWETEDKEMGVTLKGDGQVSIGGKNFTKVYYLEANVRDAYDEDEEFWEYDSFTAYMEGSLQDVDEDCKIQRYDDDNNPKSTEIYNWEFNTDLAFHSEYIKLVQPGYEPLGADGKPLENGIVNSTWDNVTYTLKENGSAFLMYPTDGKPRFYLYKSAFDDDAYNESDDSYGWYVSKPMTGGMAIVPGSTVELKIPGRKNPVVFTNFTNYYLGTDAARDGQNYLEVDLTGITYDDDKGINKTFDPAKDSYVLTLNIHLKDTSVDAKSPGREYHYSLSYSPATMMNWANVDENASTELGFGISGKMVFSSLFSNAEPEVVNVQDVIRDDYTFVTYLRIPDHFVPNGAPESYITIPRESNYVSDAQTPATGKVKNWFTSLKVRKLDLSDPEEETLLGHEHYDLASDGYAFYRLEVKGDGTKNLTRGAIRVTLGGVDYDFTFDGMKLQYLDTKELTTGQNPWDSAVESKWKDVPNGSAKLVSQAAFLQPGHDAYLRIWRGVPVENSPIRGFVVDGFGSGSFVIDSELNGNDLWNDTAAESAWNTLMSTADLPPQAEVNGDLTTWYDFTYNDGGVEKTFYPILHSINDATNPSDSAQENISDSFFSFGTAYVVSNEYDDAGWSDVRFRKHKYEFRYMDETKAVQDRTTSLYQGNAMPDPLKFYLYKDGEKFNLSGKVDSAEDLEFKAPNREYFQLGFYYDWTVSHKRWEWGKDVKWEMDANGDVYLSIARAGFDPDGEVGEGFDFKNHGFNYEIWAPISIVNQVWNEQSGQWENKGKIRGAIMLDEKGAFFPVEDLGVDLIFVKNEGTDDEKATYRFVKSGGTTVVSLADGSFEMLLANIDKDKNIDLDTPITVVSSNTKVLALKNGGMPYLGEARYLAKTFRNERVQIVGVGTADLTVSFKDNKGAARTVKITVTVKNVPAKNLSATGITFEKDVLAEYPYTGEAVTPEIVIRDGDYTLVAGTDYKVEPVNTAADAEKPLSDTKVGNGQFKITGLDTGAGYAGTLTKDFKIYGTLTYAYGTGIEKTPDGKDLPELPAAAKFYGAGLETLATVEAPAGYTFGWYTDAECKTAAASVPAGTSANLTYYGKWAVVEYTIKYYDGDTEITGLTPTGYNYGTAVKLPAPAAKEGYTFEGWYAAKELTGDVVTEIAATESGDKVFYAKWAVIPVPEVKKYTVTFSVDGGSAVEAQTVEEGKTAEKPADPTKEGYAFEGWFADAELKTEFDFAKAITEDVTIYAKWIKHHGTPVVVAGDMRVEAIPDQTYTGSALTPLVKVYDGNALLKEKTDYTIKYSDNTSVGTATVTITGKGSYTGSVTCQFKILPMSIEGEDFYATAPWEKYTGSEIKPGVKLFYGGKALTEGTDYEVSGSFTDAGEHTAVVTGKGNYTGERKVTFGIVDTSTTTLINDASVTYTKLKDENWTGSEIKPAVALKNGSTDLAENADYTVSYRNNIGAGTGYVVVKGIGAYAGVLEIPFTIKGLSIKKAKVSGIKSLVYDGTPLAQTGVTVKITGKNAMTLRENVDYTLSYTNNLNVGKATVVITGIGGFSGSIKKTFKITAYDIKKDEKNLVKATLQAAYPYEKGGAKPVPDVLFGDAALRANTDFKLSYKNNTKAGKTAKVTITGKGNFKGSIVKEFNVGKQNISEVYMTVPDIKLNTGKGKYISKPVLYDGNGKKLAVKTDYGKTIKYTLADGTELNSKSQVTEAGTVITVTVTGAGSYEGTITASYTIREKSTKTFTIKKIKIRDQEFDGKPVILDSADFTTLKVGKNDLTLGKDFEILEDSYFDNDAKGTASVIIRGIGDYTGQKQVKFKVLARKIEIK